MNIGMNGKAIDFIDLDPMWSMHGNPERVAAYGSITLHLSATFHGDHEQYWIVMLRDGQEMARFRPQGVQHIRWSAVTQGVNDGNAG